MKSPPPLSPYGVFSGQLFQYKSNPALIAFESASQSNNKCILIGGLSDGPIPTPYSKLLEEKCHSLGWSLVQPILSSSYLGFGHRSLVSDTDEITQLMDYLVCHHSATNFALVGHSTGCQNSIHFLKHGRKDVVDMVKVVALQAPVSDRESLSMTPGDHSTHLSHARSLLAEKKENEMMPRSAFWAPITAKRYISLFDVNGDDDFFSSDLSEDELIDRLGHVGSIGRESGLRLLAAFSSKDEYVPDFVEKDVLLKRLVSAMNNNNNNHNDKTNNVAEGLMLSNANHNLSDGEESRQQFVDAVGNLMIKLN